MNLFMIKICLREKDKYWKLQLKDDKIQEIPPFGKFVTEVLIFWSSRSQIFFKIPVLKNFAIFTGKNLCWPLHTFFYRTPTLAASGFSRQQILFSAESGIYCWQSHLFLPELLWKHELNFRSSHRNYSVKKGVFRNFASFAGRQLCWSLFLTEF